jgi:hypothetical protein
MSTIVSVIHWLAAVIVLAEALNKLERSMPHAPGIGRRQRVVDSLKALSWALMALGAGGALVGPLLGGLGLRIDQAQVIIPKAPSASETVTMLGLAFMIIRTRVKEG